MFSKGSLHRKTTPYNAVRDSTKPLKYLLICAGAEKRSTGKRGLQILVLKPLPAQNAWLTFNGDRSTSALV